jgi:tetratricopeptide (TPR) repeat protein
VQHRVRAYGKDALLVLLALVAYAPVVRDGFIWDDAFVIVNNPNMHGWDGLLRSWTQPTSLRHPWYPLTYTTFWLEYALVGAEPLLYHVDNALLHAVDAVLLFRLAAALGIPGAWLAGALFAVHPIHVESVAWIVERKNVLAGFFLLLCLHAFVRAADLRDVLAPPARPRAWNDRWLLAALAAFVLAMLAKTAVAPAAGALLVLIWLARGRVSARDAARVAPFVAVAGALSAITIWMETQLVGAGEDFVKLAWLERALLFPRALWFYAAKLAFPTNLMFFYPRWQMDAREWTQWLPLAAAVAVLGVCVALRARVGRGPLAAVLIYAGMLVPVSGFFNVVFMLYSFVQNHFVYFASMPLVVLAGALLHRLADRLPLPRTALAALVLTPLCALTWSESRVFADDERLWQTSVERNPRAWMALTNLGAALIERGEIERSERYLLRAIAVNPDDTWAHHNLGVAMARQGRYREAIPHYRAAIRAMPDNHVSWSNLGIAFAHLGKRPAALKALHNALAIDPSYLPAQEALAQLQDPSSQ